MSKTLQIYIYWLIIIVLKIKLRTSKLATFLLQQNYPNVMTVQGDNNALKTNIWWILIYRSVWGPLYLWILSKARSLLGLQVHLLVFLPLQRKIPMYYMTSSSLSLWLEQGPHFTLFFEWKTLSTQLKHHLLQDLLPSGKKGIFEIFWDILHWGHSEIAEYYASQSHLDHFIK